MKSVVQLLSFLLAVNVCAAEIKEVNTVGRVSRHDQVMEIADIFEASRIFQNTGIVPEAIDPNNVPSLKVKHGLTDSCQSKLCEMFYYALSCKALDLGFNKDCAAYFLGANFACPQFPSPDDFFNAPSVCADQMGALVATLATGNIVSVMTDYLGQDFETNSCGRHCYQSYQMASKDFYLSCQNQFTLNATTAGAYLVANKIANFQQFRNQACTKNNNATNANCYVQLTKPAPTGTPTPNIFQQECNYVGITPAMSGPVLIGYENANKAALVGICDQFKAWGCCAANNMVMLANGQTNTSNIQEFPPCLTTYLSNTCGIDFTNFCQNGSIASVSTVQSKVTVGAYFTNTQKFLFPNMYNRTSVLQLQGAISGVLQTLMTPAGQSALQPFNFNPHYPFQVSIISYTYQYANGTAISKVDADGNPTGGLYFPLEGDYEIANNAGGQITVTYQMTMQNMVNESQAAQFFDSAAAVMPFLNFVYGGAGFSATSSVKSTQFFAAQPLVLPPNSANSILGGSVIVIGAVVTAVTSLWLL